MLNNGEVISMIMSQSEVCVMNKTRIIKNAIDYVTNNFDVNEEKIQKLLEILNKDDTFVFSARKYKECCKEDGSKFDYEPGNWVATSDGLTPEEMFKNGYLCSKSWLVEKENFKPYKKRGKKNDTI